MHAKLTLGSNPRQVTGLSKGKKHILSRVPYLLELLFHAATALCITADKQGSLATSMGVLKLLPSDCAVRQPEIPKSALAQTVEVVRPPHFNSNSLLSLCVLLSN